MARLKVAGIAELFLRKMYCFAFSPRGTSSPKSNSNSSGVLEIKKQHKIQPICFLLFIP